MAGTYEVPATGSPNSSEDPKIKTFIESWNSKLNAENDLEDSGIASPNNSFYRTLLTTTSGLIAGKAAGTYVFTLEGAGTLPLSGATIGSNLLPYFYFAKADYEVAGKTQKLRLRAQVGCNATKPTMKYTIGLYPISSTGGGAGEFKVTLGTVVSGSTIEFNEPAASVVTSKETADFTIPADGAYALGMVTSAETTASSYVKIATQLQTRSV